MTFYADLHVHTRASRDAEGSVDELADAARNRGMHAIAICDSNRFTQLPEREDMLLIPGCEIPTQEGCLLGLFLEDRPDLAALREEGLPTGADAIEEIHRCGGIAVLAHPFQDPAKTAEDYADLVPDAIETCCARAGEDARQASTQASALAANRSLPGVGGSDAHSVKEVGFCFTSIECDSCDLTALRNAIVTGQAQAVFITGATHVQTGLSRIRSSRRSGKQNLVAAVAYLCVCWVRDLFRKK